MDKKEIQHIIKLKQKQINFTEDDHVYRFAAEEFISVTTLISKYANEFDPDGKILKACAYKENISEYALKNRWNEKRDKACSYGTAVHELLEKNMDYGRLLNRDETEKYPHAMNGIMFTEKLLESCELLCTEPIVYSDCYKVAGQIDFIIYNSDGTVSLGDWKTNEYIVANDKYNNKLKGPIKHLVDNSYNKYCLQLSMYKYLLEQWGIKVRDLFLVHLSKTGSRVIECDYLEKEVKEMLEERI